MIFHLKDSYFKIIILKKALFGSILSKSTIKKGFFALWEGSMIMGKGGGK